MIKPKVGEYIVDVIFGSIVILVGLSQLPNYFTGINPPANSSAISIPANPGEGFFQAALIVLALLGLITSIRSKRKWVKNTVLAILAIILITEVGMSMAGV